jgi:hypothetical protein
LKRSHVYVVTILFLLQANKLIYRTPYGHPVIIIS